MAAPTLEKLLPFVGGELDVQNMVHGHKYRGPVKQVGLGRRPSDLAIELDWFARGIGDPEPAAHWVLDPEPIYRISPKSYHATIDKHGRMVMTSGIMHELVIIYPPNYAHTRLARTRVADKVKLFMDDLRPAPQDALVARDIDSIIKLFDRIIGLGVTIDELWLDHDLGTNEAGATANIMPLVAKLEEAAVYGRRYNIGTIYVHSDNSSAREVMLRSLRHHGYNCRIASFRSA